MPVPKWPLHTFPVLIAHQSEQKEDDVDDPPETQTTHSAEFKQTKYPATKIETVGSEVPEEQGKPEGRPPALVTEPQLVLKVRKPLLSVGVLW
jgi:hypothetical protein